MIQVDRVSKRFKNLKVLDRAELTVPDHSIIGILGPSGVGKTVLLRIMAGLLPPDSGRILYDGRAIKFGPFADNKPIIGGLAYVFQTGALFDSMTVAENVALPLREALHLKKAEVKERVDRVLEMVGMQDKAGAKPPELSGGLMRLAAIARSVVRDPRYIFFDEPTTGLDPAMRGRMCEMITSLGKKDGKTMVVVTHDLDAARSVADHLFMLKGGNLVPADDVQKEDYEQAYT